MPALTPYFAKLSFDRLAPHLADGVRRSAQQLLGLLAEDGQARVADIHEALFPLAKAASANAMLNKLIRDFNAVAEARSFPLRLEITAAKNPGAAGRWVWFEGPATAPLAQPTPDLNAIPEDRLTAQRGMPFTPTVVLLTVNEHETRAVLEAFCGQDTPRTETRGGVTYNRLGLHGGMEIVHALSEMGSGSLGAAQQRTRDAIEAWSPRAVVAVGIAFGVDASKQAIGDVLVSTLLRSYELARVNANGTLTLRASYPDASPNWLNRIKTVDASFQRSQPTAWPKLRTGPILSGEKLVDSLDYRDSLKAHATEAVGGEMEGTGLYVSAHRAKVDWIVVKAICDWADGHKDKDKDKSQRLAAVNAARVVKAAIDAGNLYPDFTPGPSGGEPAPRPLARAVWRAHEQGLRDLDGIPEHLLDTKAAAALASLHKDRPAEVAGDAPGVDVLDYLLRWVEEADAPPLFALLGEYGMGKTITCQRLARALDARHAADPAGPPVLYLDLRHVTGLDRGVPDRQAVVEECIRRGWQDQARDCDYEAVGRLLDRGAVLILDGLDEVLVKLSAGDGQVFTQQLLRLLEDALDRRRLDPAPQGPPPRLLLSCRTQYFRSLRDQQTHFTGQERGERGAESYRALLLLPFGEAQVRRYLAAALPEADPERLLETIRAVHNLEELTRRPYTLKLVAEFIPEIEQDRAEGRAIHGVTLYRRMALRWLERDSGKHHLKPEHKLLLARHLAAELWRRGRRVLPVGELEDWFHAWLDSQPALARRYRDLKPDQLEEDLRTATFLAREDAERPGDSGFRFAHTSLQEFFLADHLLEAIRQNQPERWNLGRPSRETLDFLGQMLAEAADPELLATLGGWRKTYRAGTSELLLDYALTAHAKGWPTPTLHGMDLRGARLRGWDIGVPAEEPAPDADSSPAGPGGQNRLPSANRGMAREASAKPAPGQRPGPDLEAARFAGADLRDTRFHAVRLARADFSGARLVTAEFPGCRLDGARFQGADLTGAVFRHACLQGATWDGARSYRTQFVLCEDAPADLPQALRAPAPRAALPASLSLVVRAGHRGGVQSCAWSPDGARLLSGGEDGSLRLWDAATGENLRVMAAHEGEVRSCAWSPDGARLLSGGRDGSLRLWDAGTGENLRVMAAHEGEVWSCAWSPDGARLLSGGEDGTLRLWDAGTGEALRVLEGHGDWVRTCAWSPNGARLLSGGDDGTLRLWDAGTGEALRVLEGHGDWVRSCAWSPDGTRLLSGGRDGSLRLWDAGTGEALRVLEGHRGGVRSCAWSPNGARLLSGGTDGTLRLWDAGTGEALRVLEGHGGWVWSCAWSPDGTRLLSGGEDGTVRLWDAASGALLRVHALWRSARAEAHAVWEPASNRVVEASAEAWRWLAWQDGQCGRWPLESFGPVPAPARLGREG